MEIFDLLRVEKEVMELSREVGAFIARESAHFDRSYAEQKSSFRDLVSYVDKEAERQIVKGLTKILPQAGIMAEEGSQAQSVNGYRWIIDPLDGTTNFYHGLPPYAVSIGLVKETKPVVGVVHEVTRNECFHATSQSPTYCNDQEVRVAPTATLREGLLSTGFPYYRLEGKYGARYLSTIRSFMENTHGVRRIGSAAVDLAYVACGRLDGFFEYDLQPWDVAAGSLLVMQAGGQASDFSGGDNFIFGGEICAAGHIHTNMLDVLRSHWVESGQNPPKA